jgi:hypothetical protein
MNDYEVVQKINQLKEEAQLMQAHMQEKIVEMEKALREIKTPSRIELDYVHAYYRPEKDKWVIRFNWHGGDSVAANAHITQTDSREDAQTLVCLFNKVAAITAEAGLPYIH